jgi:kynureninase
VKTSIDRAAADALDERDPLRGRREAYLLPEGVIYLDGNSLGPLSKAALRELRSAAEQEWGLGLIRSWNAAGWFELPLALGNRIGRLIGAAPGETVVSDSTSINIHKALHAALSLRPGRSVIVAEAESFPTDLYIAQGLAGARPGVTIRLEGVDGPRIEDLIGEDVACVLVNHVDYRNSVLRDMTALTARIHASGAVVVWDLCHSAGAMKVDLAAAKADLAVGCTYKYLNGGPGAPSFVTVATCHHGRFSQPLTGWWGHARPFAFEQSYAPGGGIRPMLCGTQPILSMRALSGALEDWEGVDLDALRAKSLSLSDLFIALVEESCGRFGVTLAAPRERAIRGSQVSFRHPSGHAVMQALIDRGVIGDFRAPDYIRFGFAPLYLSHANVYRAAEILHDILARETWRDPRFAVRGAVT